MSRRSRPLRAPVLVFGALVCLLAAAAAIASRSADAGLPLFAAAFIGAELLRLSRVEEALADPLEPEPFTLSAPVLVAAMVVAGPWPAVLVGAGGALAGPLLRRGAWSDVPARAIELALAALAGGYAFVAAGGATGHLVIADDVVPLAALTLAYAATRTVLRGLVAGVGSYEPDARTIAGEAGLGVVLALAAVQDFWLLAAAVPVLLLLDQAQHRLLLLRREVASALETFANIVDERDPTTYRHSLRVAGYVEELARALGLPPVEIARLRWAGRLHDLGKVAVDSAVLRNRGRLSASEWAAVQRAPRLSARLLQRFRFAARQAQAVEYHHERLDGSGYYGVGGADIPLASHFLVLADSFDAMTTDRPFRAALSREHALAEIERHSGTQFHPTLVRAFVAVQRGRPAAEALSPEELAELRDACSPQRGPALSGRRGIAPHRVAVLGGVLLALVGLGVASAELIVAGLAGAAVGGARALLGAALTRRVARDLDVLLASSAPTERVFDGLADRLERAGASWLGLLAWFEDGLGGTLQLERGRDRPNTSAVVSWLLREAESGSETIVAAPHALDGAAGHLALPLRRENSALVGFLVVASRRPLPGHVEAALRETAARLAHLLAARPSPAPAPPAVAVSTGILVGDRPSFPLFGGRPDAVREGEREHDAAE